MDMAYFFMNYKIKLGIFILGMIHIHMPYKGHCQGMVADSLLTWLMTNSHTLKGKSLSHYAANQKTFSLVFYNNRNCGKCFFDIEATKREKLFLCVITPTNEMGKHLLNEKYKHAYDAIFYFTPPLTKSNSFFTQPYLDLYTNQIQTPYVMHFNKSQKQAYNLSPMLMLKSKMAPGPVR